ncbi:hypothetical protein OAE56_03190 [Verrucomicrobiales bacterium]|nr:hypothetical protein [Verrucomicrobiales bacterium]
MPEYRGKVERLILYTVQAIDWNCPQHITRRYSLDEIDAGIAAGDATFLDLIPSEHSQT